MSGCAFSARENQKAETDAGDSAGNVYRKIAEVRSIRIDAPGQDYAALGSGKNGDAVTRPLKSIQR